MSASRKFGRVFLSLISIVATLVLPPILSSQSATATTGCSSLSLINGDFEAHLPGATPNNGSYVGDYLDAEITSDRVHQYYTNYAVPGIGWNTTESDSLIEFWNGNPQNAGSWIVQAYDGNQFVELNANYPSGLYQDIATTPGQKIKWQLAHRGRLGVDVMRVLIGSARNSAGQIQPERFPGTETPTSLIQQGSPMSDGTSKWGVYSGVYKVPAGQTLTRFQFEAVTSIGGDSWGNFLDGISFAPADCTSVTPTYDPPSISQSSDGFTVQLTNYNSATMSAVADTGTVSISQTGLVTVAGVAPGVYAVATVTNQEPGSLAASVTITSSSLGSALIPNFGNVTASGGQLSLEISNFDPQFTWSAVASDQSAVTIDSGGIVSVAGSANDQLFLTLKTSRTGYASGANAIQLNFLIELNSVVSQEAAAVSIPDPLQTDSVTATSFDHIGLGAGDTFTALGQFQGGLCSIRNISVDGTNIPFSSWTISDKAISFLLPATIGENFAVQIYNGCAPLMPEIKYNYQEEFEKAYKLLILSSLKP